MIHGQISKNITKQYEMVDRGLKPGLFYVLALSKRPGILLEVGFLSNTIELKKMSSAKFRESFSNSIVAGIDNYFYGATKNIPPLL